VAPSSPDRSDAEKGVIQIIFKCRETTIPRMDDNTFDHRTAADWINTVESESGRIRDTDIYPLLNAWVNGIAPCDILDIGSGQGICSSKIDLDARNYTGVDPSPFLVERAKELYSHENRKFIQGNVYDLPCLANGFDAAFSIAVWHLLGNLQRATSELSRVLRPTGHFFIVTANPGAYSAWTGIYSDPISDGRRFEGTVHHPDKSVSQDVLYLHTLNEITDALYSAHFRIEAVETFRTIEGSGGQGKFILIRGNKQPSSRLR
jgi:SAM-dependent methyltransferase